jgi:hypothetical protein
MCTHASASQPRANPVAAAREAQRLPLVHTTAAGDEHTIAAAAAAAAAPPTPPTHANTRTQVVCATSIMVVTALKLHHVAFNWDSKSWNADVHNVCLLGHMDNGGNL